MARMASRAALISMRWLVEDASNPQAQRPPGIAHAHPPGPGFPEQAPSVYTLVISAGRIGNMIFDGFAHQLPDVDPSETKEWVESFDAVVDAQGKSRASFILMKLL